MVFLSLIPFLFNKVLQVDDEIFLVSTYLCLFFNFNRLWLLYMNCLMKVKLHVMTSFIVLEKSIINDS